jgi:putative addiction module component (TIGR02574 family)
LEKAPLSKFAPHNWRSVAEEMSLPRHAFPRYNHRMAHTYEEVLEFATALPEAERLRLADSLWTSVEPDTLEASELDPAWEAEIARRVAEIKAGTATTYSLEEVEAELKAIVGS